VGYHLPSLLLFRFTKLNRYSIAVLAGALENNKALEKVLEIKLLDKFDLNTIENYLKKYKPIILAYSMMTAQRKKFFREWKILKTKFKQNIIIITGGPHPTARPEECYKNGADWVVIGEGENTINTLLENIILHNEREETISGTFSKYGYIPRSKHRVNLDDFPPFSIKYRLLSPIEISRGCPFNCYYCATPFIMGLRMRHRSVDKVVYWLKQAIKIKNIDKTWFITPNSFAYGGNGVRPNYEKVHELLDMVSTINEIKGIYFGSFPSEVRPEFVTEEMLRIIKPYVANKTLQIGAQSGSEHILKIAHRRHTIEDVYNAIEISIKYGFTPHVDMIFGLPGETDEDREMNIRMLLKIIDMGGIVHAHTFMPLPGSVFENEPPGTLDKRTKKILGQLSNEGKVTGSWAYQEKLARDMVKTY